MTATAKSECSNLDEQVLEIVRRKREGVSAGEVVEDVTARAACSESDVRASLRALLEKGMVEVGSKLRLVIAR